jgi:hypothetical protein
MKLCSEAIRYGVNEKEIFVLSLGTGMFFSDPLRLSDNQGLLFWGSEITNLLIAAQESNTNVDMHYRYGERYIRMQPFLPKPIGLDDFQSMNTLIDCALDHWTEFKYSDQFNKLIEFLELTCDNNNLSRLTVR